MEWMYAAVVGPLAMCALAVGIAAFGLWVMDLAVIAVDWLCSRGEDNTDDEAMAVAESVADDPEDEFWQHLNREMTREVD